MNDDEQKRSDQAMQFLIMLRNLAEEEGNDERAQMISDLLWALTTGEDHPLLDRWLMMQGEDSELVQQHREYLIEWQKGRKAKR
jgi:hypothetical protein